MKKKQSFQDFIIEANRVFEENRVPSDVRGIECPFCYDWHFLDGDFCEEFKENIGAILEAEK